MLTDKDTWHLKPRTRLVHAVWHGALLAMERAVQQLSDAGENRHALQLAHYADAVSDAAERHLDGMTQRIEVAEPVNGHGVPQAGVNVGWLSNAKPWEVGSGSKDQRVPLYVADVEALGSLGKHAFEKITIAGVDSAHLNPARESTEPVNGHGTNAACNSAANGIGATCAGAGLSADSHLPTGQPRTTATVAEVESELDALASLSTVFANDPQAYEVALKFMGEAHSLACRGLGEAALRKLLAAKNVLRGGGEV